MAWPDLPTLSLSLFWTS